MNDQQVLQAISDAYAYFGSGADAHREIARFMRQNSVPVEQVARLTGYPVQAVQADFDAFSAQEQQSDQQNMAVYEQAKASGMSAEQVSSQYGIPVNEINDWMNSRGLSLEAPSQQQSALSGNVENVAAQQQAAQQEAAQRAAAETAAQQAAQQAAAQQAAPQIQRQINTSVADQQVQDVINTAYAQHGGAGPQAHAAIANYMEQNNVPVGQVARITGFTPQEVQAEFSAQTSPQAKQQQIQNFFQTNPNATDQQIFQYMQQNNLSPDQVIQTMGLPADDSMRRYREQLVNTAVRGNVTQDQLKAYFANNPNATDAEIYQNMVAYGVTPQQVAQSLGMPLSEAMQRFRDQKVANTPTGLLGFEESAQQGLADATGSIRAGETQSRGDINSALQNINQLLTQNIGGLQSAGTQASNQINTGFDAALQNINRLYGVNIDDLRVAAQQASGQVNTGFDEARGYFEPFQQGGQQAFQQQLALSGALGQDAFNQAYQESPQIAFLREQGMRSNLAGAAATGGLGGGNVQKELQRFGQGLASQGLQQQISNLSGLSGMGMQGAQNLSGLATGRAGALGDITLNTAQNIAGQRGTQAQAVSGLQTGRAGALGEITLNTAQNIAGQRGNMANFAGQAGVNLANISQRAGEGVADLQYGTGRDIATQRGRAGELLANQYQNVYGNQARLLQEMGANQSNLIGGQASDLINMQNAAALRAQQNAINLGGNVANLETGLATNTANLQTGLATNTANQITGQPLYNQQPFNYAGMYGNAFNAAAAGYDMYDQAVNARQNPAPVSTSVPAYVNPNTFGPMRSGYNMPPQRFNQPMPTGVHNTQSMIWLGGLV